MDIRNFKTFKKIVETGSFSKAAAEGFQRATGKPFGRPRRGESHLSNQTFQMHYGRR